MRIVFTGGGTGGHVFPIVAVAQEVKKTGPHRMYYVGPSDDFTADAFANEDVSLRIIPAGSPSKGASHSAKIPLGVLASLWHLFWIMPDVVFSKGGYGAAPVLIAAWVYNIPIVLHDSDAVPGRVTQQFAERAKAVFFAFEKALEHISPTSEQFVVGNPVRELLANGNAEEARAEWKVGLERPVVLIMGSSQGAQPINDLVLSVLPRLLERADIVHITGKRNIDEVRDRAKRELGEKEDGYHVVGFLGERKLANAYALATLVVNRAGAGSLFEVAYAGKPSIIIPLPHAAQNHQLENARTYGDAKAAVILEQENTTPNLFLDAVDRVLSDPKLQATLKENARAFARPDAGERIAKHLLTYE